MIHLQTASIWGGWATDMLQSALDYWADTFKDIFNIMTVSPDQYMGGAVWSVVEAIMNTLQAIGSTLVVIFFLYGIIKSSISFRDLMRQPTQIVGMFIRLILAKFVMSSGAQIMLKLLYFAQELITKIHTGAPTLGVTVPAELVDAFNNASLGNGLGAFCAALIGTLVIFLLSIIVMVIVYGRFFKIFLLAAISPLPLSGIAAEATEYIGLNFLKSYIGECLRGVVILTACRIFTAIATTVPSLDPSASVAGMAWTYVAGVVMNMLILVILVKMSDRIVKEIFSI